MSTARKRLTAAGLVIVRMTQDTLFCLAEPEKVTEWQTTTLCGRQIMARVDVSDPSDTADVPLSRGRNEFQRCTRCDTLGRERMAAR